MKCEKCEGKGMISLGAGIRGITKCPAFLLMNANQFFCM